MWSPDKRSVSPPATTADSAPSSYSRLPWSSTALLMRMERTRRRFFLILLPALSLVWLFRHHDGLRIARSRWSVGMEPVVLDTGSDAEGVLLADVNSTLGFGAVVAVSHAKSPRREGLLWAANLTGIDIVIPEQPQWTDSDVENFRAKEGSKINRGSAMAWMGHLNALRWFLSTPHSTALILEDDVDFSLTLRTQIALASTALRTLLTPHNTTSSPHLPAPPIWPPPPTWEILYLGHCGDAATPTHILTHANLAYTDPTVLPLRDLSQDTASLLQAFNLTNVRIVYRSWWPLCTFAYGVTRASAQRILEEYGAEGEGGCVAFDVRMLEACRDAGWACWSLAPELFHHVRGSSEITSVNAGQGAEGEADTKGQEEGKRKPSVNIACGARDADLWVEPGDREMRKWMLEEVPKGECLVQGGNDSKAGLN